jgi:hypothetical protein
MDNSHASGQRPLLAASGDSLKLPIAAVGVVSLGRERQLTGAGANSHYRPGAVRPHEAKSLWNHLVGPKQHGLRNFDAERLGSICIKDHLEMRRLLDG